MWSCLTDRIGHEIGTKKSWKGPKFELSLCKNDA